MLGTLRLVLALLVAYSHAGHFMFGLNPGVSAVVVFYLISGYVMAGLISRHYSSPGKAAGFYADRAMRLLPQYFFIAGVTLAWYFAARPQNFYLAHPPTVTDLINNLLIVPLNFYMWNESNRFVLIPPAWSLGAEIQFYLLAPLLLYRRRPAILAGAASLCVYCLALTGKINSDWFGYRLLPGALFFFMCGALLFQLHRTNAKAATILAVAVPLLAAIGAIALAQTGTLALPYNRETLFGLLTGVPLIHLLAKRRRKAWDERLGDLSYGVFLNHFLILWVLFPLGVPFDQLPWFFGASVAFSSMVQRIIERPFLSWRLSLRSSGKKSIEASVLKPSGNPGSKMRP